MEIRFTRGSGRTYTTSALRDDGVLLQVPSHDRTSTLPHDLAHFVVERELGLTHGFWGCVASGALFPGMTVTSGRQPPRAAERSQAVVREAGQRGTEAEVLVGVLLGIVHDGLADDGQAACLRVSQAWRPSRPSRPPLQPEEVRRVCAALREARESWQALAVGESLTVSWPRARPAKR
jgi:hypothetical protein